MPPGERTDPYRGFNFRVEIDDTPVASFAECSGLTAEGDAVDYREGTDLTNHVRKLVGMRKYPNITLKRGYTKNAVLWEWYKNILDGVQDRRDGSIILMDEAHAPVMRWNFTNAFINKIEGPSLKANSNDVVMESIELVHESLELELV
jgi:phage tail-like protein